MATRGSKRRRTQPLAGEPSGAAASLSEIQQPDEYIPTGHPFTDAEVVWRYTRYHLVNLPHKIMITGYETMASDIRATLDGLPVFASDKVRKSCMGCFTRLDDYNTKCCKMLQYVVFRQVDPIPNFDPTSLFFKIGNKVLRFSRVEYALVSGLSFGPVTFNPYKRHELPPNSIFERLFGANTDTTTADVHTAYTKKGFKVNKKKVFATTDDYVKLSKLLLALGFALGLNTSKKKIPLWLWALIEDDKEWEEFPWGSYSYQLLVDCVKNIVKKDRGSKQLNIHIKGNMIAFSAWIFEAIPGFGQIVGQKKSKRERPRFIRYSYLKKRGYPTVAQIEESLVPMLKPHKRELHEKYWKSLDHDPEGVDFVFQFDAYESMKKRPRDKGEKEEEEEEEKEEEKEEENEPAAAETVVSTVSIVPTSFVTVQQLEKAVEAGVKKAYEQFDELLKKYHEKLVKDVGDYVINRVLDKAPTANDSMDINCHNVDNWDHLDQHLQREEHEEMVAASAGYEDANGEASLLDEHVALETALEVEAQHLETAAAVDVLTAMKNHALAAAVKEEKDDE